MEMKRVPNALIGQKVFASWPWTKGYGQFGNLGRRDKVMIGLL